ncbi:flavin reductase family protein [Pyrobaculum sp.]|uniref:flavin reductase family protein n=1 Tax=Pyrobaculum sp. TaxID=2004705 RepID=UPI0031605312
MKEVNPELAHYVMYPATVPIIAAKSGNELGAMPAVWTTAVSMSPPLVLTVLAPERRTYRLVRESGFFTVNYLDFSKVESLALVGDVSARFAPDKLEKAGLRLVPARKVPSVAVEDAAAVIECSLKSVLDVGGDHDIFIGRVEALYVADDFTEGGWRLETYKPILYVGRTRRPGPIKRRFATVGEVREVEYGRGMGQAVEERRRAYQLAEEAVRELAAKMGRDPRDVAYILLDVLKNLLGPSWR